MSEPNETPRYDVETNDNGGVYFGLGWHTHTTTIRDNETGKEYSNTHWEAKESRDRAWEQVRQDDDD